MSTVSDAKVSYADRARTTELNSKKKATFLLDTVLSLIGKLVPFFFLGGGGRSEPPLPF